MDHLLLNLVLGQVTLAMEGMVDQEATSLEGMEEQEMVALAKAMAATDLSEAPIVVVDLVLAALEVTVEVVEAHLDRRLRVVGHPTMNGTGGTTHEHPEVSMSRAESSTRRSPRAPSTSTLACLVGLRGGKRCAITSSGDAAIAFISSSGQNNTRRHPLPTTR